RDARPKATPTALTAPRNCRTPLAATSPLTTVASGHAQARRRNSPTAMAANSAVATAKPAAAGHTGSPPPGPSADTSGTVTPLCPTVRVAVPTPVTTASQDAARSAGPGVGRVRESGERVVCTPAMVGAGYRL